MESGELPPRGDNDGGQESSPRLLNHETKNLLTAETPRERWLHDKIVNESGIPPESLTNPTVKHFVMVVNGINQMERGLMGSGLRPEIETPRDPLIQEAWPTANWATRYGAWNMTVAQDQWLRAGFAEARFGDSVENVPSRFWAHAPLGLATLGVMVDRVEPTAHIAQPKVGLWRTADYDETLLRLAGEVPGSPLEPEYETTPADRERVWYLIDEEARRDGIAESLLRLDIDVAVSVLALARARALMEATAPDVLDRFPPAPGLDPSAQDRLRLAHQLNRAVVATFEDQLLGKKPATADLAHGLADALRPVGGIVIADPEHE